MATLETITSASTPTLKPVKYVTEGYNSIKFVGVATYREFLEDVKETSRIVIEVSFLYAVVAEQADARDFRLTFWLKIVDSYAKNLA